jgi:hypothetical protein
MLQVMLGALIQILPVVAGANMPTPARSRSWCTRARTWALLLVVGLLLSDTARSCFLAGRLTRAWRRDLPRAAGHALGRAIGQPDDPRA